MTTNIHPEIDKLTPRERQVYLLVAEGKSDQEIRETLGISVNTVKTHIKKIKRKLAVQGRGWAISPLRDDRKDLPTL